MLKRRLKEVGLATWVRLKWWVAFHARSVSHRPTPGIVISLTSFPPRYPTLGLTLKSLLMQRVRPEKVLLWIAAKDMAAIPEEIRQLESNGLQILECEDFRSYNKFIHALRYYPDYKIAICDDDTYYPPHWLGDLLEPVAENQIAGHRLHLIHLDEHSQPLPYGDWLHEGGCREPTPLNFPTGVGGILLEARKFAPEVIDAATARRLSPTADDMWLYLMGRRAGCEFVRVGKPFALISWRSSQEVALWQTNNTGERANDRQLQALLMHFGAQGVFE
ncbi:glycosyltransferase family 2 protein [Rhizobium sp. AQ_MP]|uniref:glycosyltransferase family A protein n=1 Tax=Rhizobium sp. AQ_MP TaxID=2761536 RepID=UPI00163AF6F3|nr:glycosyltransferase family A protein [Rhizobium sp. AQ_MP]MBC2775891.1 glycosyltransferase family 2 protein [Rhizobium sp. AQ_MP]